MRQDETRGNRTADATHAVRVDKWLWAARFFKSRALAVAAITGGKVEANGDRVKPSHSVRAGDELRLRLGPYEFRLIVKEAGERRGPASDAARLYEETAESREIRERLRWQLKHAAPVIVPGEGRPTKKARRDLGRLKDF